MRDALPVRGGKISSFAKGIDMLNSVYAGLMAHCENCKLWGLYGFTLLKASPLAHGPNGKKAASNAGRYFREAVRLSGEA